MTAQDELIEALRPFADAAMVYDPDENDGHMFDDDETLSYAGSLGVITDAITVGDLRRARAALASASASSTEDPPLPSPNYEKLLGELLAVIHRDGGHHEAENGTERAVKDAIDHVYDWIAQEESVSSRATAMPVRGVFGELVKCAELLYQNAEGCAANHYGTDFEQQGLPGWLSDSRETIRRAKDVADHLLFNTSIPPGMLRPSTAPLTAPTHRDEIIEECAKRAQKILDDAAGEREPFNPKCIPAALRALKDSPQ